MHVLVDLALDALERAREEQHHAHHDLVLRDDVEDFLAAGVVVVVLPQADLLRAAEHGFHHRVDRRLDLSELWVHLGALGGHLDAHLEERLVDEEEGGERARRDAALECLEREARAVLHRLVRGRREVLGELRNLGGVDRLLHKRERVLHDLDDQILERVLDLDALGGHRVLLRIRVAAQ